MEKIVKNLNYIIMIFFVLLVPILFCDKIIMAYFSYDIIKFEYNDFLWYLIIPLLFIYVYNIFKKNIKLSFFDYLIFLIIFLDIIVCIFAINSNVSIFGNPYRHEGFLSFVSYYLIFLNCKSITDNRLIKNILNIYICIGIIQFVYCFIQIYLKSLLLPNLSYNISSNMATGFINNSNFLGSYIILLIGIVMMRYLTQEKKYIRYLILSIIFFANLIFTQSTGPFLGFICMIVFALILLIVKKRLLIKRFLVLFFCLVMSYFLIDYTISVVPSANSNITDQYYTINYDLKQMYRALTGQMKIYEKSSTDSDTPDVGVSSNSISETSSVKSENNLDKLGSGRIKIWRNTLKIVPQYFWFGCGIDNFGYVYKWHGYIYYDKAHNDFLQILVTRGVFVLVVYIIFLICLFVKGIKNNNSLVWSLLISIIGYCAQSFTNISVINVAPYFYMICGFMVAIINNEKIEEKNE